MEPDSVWGELVFTCWERLRFFGCRCLLVSKTNDTIFKDVKKARRHFHAQALPKATFFWEGEGGNPLKIRYVWHFFSWRWFGCWMDFFFGGGRHPEKTSSDHRTWDEVFTWFFQAKTGDWWLQKDILRSVFVVFFFRSTFGDCIKCEVLRFRRWGCISPFTVTFWVLQVVHQVIWLVKMRFGETSAGHFITTKGTQDTFLGSEMARWWRGWDAGKLKSSINSSWDPCHIFHLEEPKKMAGIFPPFFLQSGFVFVFFCLKKKAVELRAKNWEYRWMCPSLSVSSDSNMKLKREIHEAYTWNILMVIFGMLGVGGHSQSPTVFFCLARNWWYDLCTIFFS